MLVDLLVRGKGNIALEMVRIFQRDTMDTF